MKSYKSKLPTLRSLYRLFAASQILVFIIFLMVTVPRLTIPFAPTTDTLDLSWSWMLGYGIQQNLQWGKNILFTYGPLGFLNGPYLYPDYLLWKTAALVRLLSWIFFGVLFAICLFRLSGNKIRFLVFFWPAAVAWIVGAGKDIFNDISTQSTLIALLMLIVVLGEENKSIKVGFLSISGTLLALGTLIKSTSLVVSVFSILLFSILEATKKINVRTSNRYHPIILISSYLISFIILWHILGQSFFCIPAYLRGTWAIIIGYTPAMETYGAWQQLFAALVIMTAFFSVAVGFMVRKKWTSFRQTFLLTAVTAWAWKEGFTRHDPGFVGHADIFFGVALIVASIGLILSSKDMGKFALGFLALAYCIAFLFSPLSNAVYSAKENYREFYRLISSKTAWNLAQKQQKIALRNQFLLPHALLNSVKRASVSILPWSVMLAEGYGMKLVASPVFQSYSAYTPYLDKLNARQIWKDNGADKIIYSYEAIDGRYPAFDEPATFRAILSCYWTQYAGKSYSVFTHTACMRQKTISIGKKGRARFGKWVGVPPGASYARLNIHTTTMGHIISTIYKPDLVYISFRLGNGDVEGPYRFIYNDGNDGLYVKFFLASQEAVNQLFARNTRTLLKIVGIKLTTNINSFDFSKNYSVSFFKTQ